MQTHSSTDLEKSPYLAARARTILNCVRQVVTQLPGKDQSPGDTATSAGTVHLQEDYVSVGEKGCLNIHDGPADGISSDAEACLAQGQLSVHIQGEEGVTGFKSLLADASCPEGKLQSAAARGYEFARGGFLGPITYAFQHDAKHNQDVFSRDLGGDVEKVVVNPDGTIACFQQGEPSWLDKLKEWLP